MNDPATTLAVQMRGVERRYRAVRVLRGVDFEIERGVGVALFGPNGAGKTTLLKILAGLVRPHAGTVDVLGERLPANAKLRRRVGVVAHESFLYADLSARENLGFYSRLYRLEPTGRDEELLDRLALRDAADRPVRGYSRGMIQRLALARAVLHRPDLLLLDEPLTGLDPQGVRLLVELITELRTDGVSVVATTHDFARSGEIADRAAILDRGRIAWSSQGAMPSATELEQRYSSVVGNGEAIG